MITEVKYPFAKANKCAEYIKNLLAPHCERINIAGSIRRLQPEVKDIEIICEPKKIFNQNGLFPDTGEWQISKEFTAALATITKEVIKGSAQGRYLQLITTAQNCPGIKLDLFMPRPEDYYRQLAIRTGSADYAHHVIAAAWSRKGWVGIGGDLFKRSECDFYMTGDKKIWKLKTSVKVHKQPPAWRSEAEFFAWLDLPYTDPEHRIVSISNEAL
jgi:DNA polymerase/3'-5' exonuclease PolX